MENGMYGNERQPGKHGPGRYPFPGRAGRLRDADWLATPRRNAAIACETHVLHRWNMAVAAGSSQLAFVPLDGNPRHGLLILQQRGEADIGGALEIVERQGRWLVMPGLGHARTGVARATVAKQWPAPWSAVAVTPDHRFMFFNMPGERGMTTFVMRRKDGGLVDQDRDWPR